MLEFYFLLQQINLVHFVFCVTIIWCLIYYYELFIVHKTYSKHMYEKDMYKSELNTKQSFLEANLWVTAKANSLVM